jgi:hypothetical protein
MTVVDDVEFSHIVTRLVAGISIAAINAQSEALLRFELRGRLEIGGEGYVRQGGPSRFARAVATDAIDVAQLAAEAAKRSPDGFIVVDALRRPWCAVGKGLSPYRRGSKPYVFGDVHEAHQFAERINLHAKGDSENEVTTVATVAFVKQTAGIANMYRRLLEPKE